MTTSNSILKYQAFSPKLQTMHRCILSIQQYVKCSHNVADPEQFENMKAGKE